jgi:hypothetical protein
MAVYDPRGGGNVHIDVVLSNISVAFPQGDFVGNQLFPQVNVSKQTNKYYIFGRESWAVEPGGDLRAPGTAANEIAGLLVSTDSYFCRDHSLRIPITQEERENADNPLDPMADGTNLVTQKVLLVRELAMRDLVVTTANYEAGLSTTLAGGQQWSDYVNSNPISDVKTGVRAVHSKLFTFLNTGVFPYQVMTQLEDHPDFIERIKYSQRGIITSELVGALFTIPNLIVPGVGYNSANPGQTPALGYIWGKDVILAYVPPSAGLKTPAYAYEFVWPYNGMAQSVERWWVQDRKSDLVQVCRRYDLKFVALGATSKSTAGYVIKAAVA